MIAASVFSIPFIINMGLLAHSLHILNKSGGNDYSLKKINILFLLVSITLAYVAILIFIIIAASEISITSYRNFIILSNLTLLISFAGYVSFTYILKKLADL